MSRDVELSKRVEMCESLKGEITNDRLQINNLRADIKKHKVMKDYLEKRVDALQPLLDSMKKDIERLQTKEAEKND